MWKGKDLMVKPSLRSRSYRRISRRNPGGRNVIHYERRKNAAMKCVRCGVILNGVPLKDIDRRRLPKVIKRPERMFGGVLCARCLREILKEVVRATG